MRVRERFARFGDLRVIEVAAGDTVEATIARLQATGRYEFVEPDHLMYTNAIPSDPSFGSQWALNNTGQAIVSAITSAVIELMKSGDTCVP